MSAQASSFDHGPGPGDCPAEGTPPLDSARMRRWREWIDRIAAGDLDACAALYDESATLAFSLLLQMVRNREAAEDALVDLFLEVRARAVRGEHRGRNPLSWLVALTRTIGMSHQAAAGQRRVVSFERSGNASLARHARCR